MSEVLAMELVATLDSARALVAGLAMDMAVAVPTG